MKVKNISPRTVVINGIPIEPNQKRTVPDGAVVEHLVKDGLIQVEQIKIKEGKHGTVSSD